MIRNFILFFLALRTADVLNLVGGMWLVPRFVAPADLGAVLPLTAFATLVAIPLYAIALTALRESVRLRALGQSPRALIRSVFVVVGVAAVLALALAAVLLPHFLRRFRLTDSLSGCLAVTAAFLGCVAPVYLDQLQAAKRFGAVSAVEVSAAAVRLAVMAAIMPFRALAGYFAGSVVRPLVQIIAPLLIVLKSEKTSIPTAASASDTGYWTHAARVRFFRTFVLLLVYLALPMLVSLMENDLVRTRLPSAASAGYYMATRISDLMNYITYPILIVMFPYVTDNAVRGKSSRHIVHQSVAVVFVIAAAAAFIAERGGVQMLALLPHGENYADFAHLLPGLILLMAFGAMQSIVTNAEVAAGRYAFLWWFVPLNVIYYAVLPRCLKSPSLDTLVAVFAAFALVRLAAALIHFRSRERRY